MEVDANNDLVTIYTKDNAVIDEYTAPRGQTAMDWARNNLFGFENADHFTILRWNGETYRESRRDHSR